MSWLRGGDWPRACALALLVIAPLLLGLRIAITGVSVDTDVQSILPTSAGGDAEIAAIRRAGAAVAARIAIGVRGGTADQRRVAAGRLAEGLTATGAFIPATDDLAATAEWLGANRYELACAKTADQMTAAWGDNLAKQARTLLFSGMVPLGGADLAADPFLLTFNHLNCLMPDAPPAGDDALVAGHIAGSPYALDNQALIARAVADWRADTRHDGLTLLRSGALFFAAAAGDQAKREITLVGGVSIALILLLYTIAFRTPATAGMALATVVAGALGGAWLCFVVFGAVHFSVFVFGSALTGISADYAVHSLAARRAPELADGPPPGLRRALTVSMLTSIAGFAALLAFDVEVFRQIGVFAMGGLGFAWLFALVALPRLDHHPRTRRNGPLMQAQATLVRTARRRSVAAASLILVAIIASLGVTQMAFQDDVRRFQSLSPDLIKEQAALSGDAQDRFSTRFLLSSGADREAALREEEAYLANAGPVATRFLATSRFDPSQDRRARIRNAYETHLLTPHLGAIRAQLGLAPAPLNTTANPSARPAWLRALEFERNGRIYLLAPVHGAIAPEHLSDPRLIEPAATYGAALEQYRRAALRLIAIAAVLAAVFLIAVYRTPRALWLVAPPLIGCVLALTVPALLGVPTTLFSVLALFVVLGAGIDFSVFQWEMRRDQTGWTGAAVLIAALSTCAAMGMLGFSATLPVQSFGVTIAVGVLGAMVFSFLAPLAAQQDR